MTSIEIKLSKNVKVIASIIAMAYILIQVFQFYVFNNLPVTHSLADELIQGSENLNIWRAVLLLISFFGLIYLFLVICAHNINYSFISTIYAFIGFFIFCSIELGLRSIELFYIQIHLPQLYKMTNDINDQKNLLSIFTNFQSVQYALYFPLLFFQAIASFILAFSFNKVQKINYIIIVVLLLNGIRLLERIFGMYLQIDVFDVFTGNMYLVSVFLIFAPISYWLLKVRDY